MKKILALLAFGLTLGVSAIAQPTINFSTESPCNGQNFCMDVTVEDFTDIKSMEFTIQYDPMVLQNPSAASFGLPGLNASSFTVDAVNGLIHVIWIGSACGTPTPGVDLPDGSLIFQICFTAMGTYAQTAEVCVAGLPVPQVFREGTGCNNIGLLSTCGLVSVCVRPVELLISDATGQPGDLVCIDFKVTGFDALRSMQFTINWNPSVLNFENVVVGSVPNLSVSSSFGTPPDLPEGTATFTWSYSLPDEPGITLQDSFLFFQICYRVVGTCEQSTLIEISDAPTMIEVTNDIVAGTNITFLPHVGTFTVGSCAPTGLQLSADCGAPVNLNDPICVKVIAGSNFNNISDFAYLMRWNSSILEYTGVQNFNPLISNFNITDFNISQVDNGILGVSWDPTPFPNETLPAGTVMYEVCFNVIGLGGNSPFSFSLPANVQVGNGPNIGINPTNCEVQVIQPGGVIMDITDGEAIPGGETCVDVNVSNFEEILDYQFSLAWDPSHMEFLEVRNINLPEATISNFGLNGAMSAGLLFFDWVPSTDYTLPDGTTIFQLCFTMLSQPNICDDLAVVDLPLISEAISATSNGENIGIISDPGNICSLFPEGYGLIVDMTEGDRLDTTCVAFSVTSFDNITSTDFEISWDPSTLQFTSVQLSGAWPGLALSNFDVTGTPVGAINVAWANAAGANIGAINDTTVVFEVCYALIGTPGECFPIQISDTPSPQVQTLNGQGSLLATDGELCINDRLIIESVTITPDSCVGSCNGTISLVVTGGEGPLGTTWTQGGFSQFTPLMSGNFCSGDTVFVKVYDQGNPALILETFYIVPLGPNQPVANAGIDRVSGCNPLGVLAMGSGSTGPGYTYRWETLQGGLIASPPLPTSNVALPMPGTFVIIVTNAQGCSARDTMVVLPPPVPMADAGTGQGFNCMDEIAILDGSASTATGVSYKWTPLDGGAIVAGEDTFAVATATGPGLYELVVRYPNSNCVARDTVLIEDLRVQPNANGGAEQRELGCSGDAITLDGSPSSNSGVNVSFQWLDPSGTPLTPGITVDVATLGNYTLIVTDDDNGCRDTAFVELIPSLDYPQVSFSGDSSLTCVRESAVFTAAIAPDTVLYDFSWTVLSGGPLVAGTETTLSPEANMEGVYQISVTNPNNSCTTLDTFIVISNMQPPVAVAGEDFSLTCDIPTHTLDATGSTLGDSITVTWTDPTGTTIPPDQLEVSAPGAYVLEILNTINGCSATDTIMINSDGQLPVVSIAVPTPITCTTTFTSLTADVQPAGTYTYAWGLQVAGQGNIIGPLDAAVTQVNEGAIYVVTVTNPANGCFAIKNVVVIGDTLRPIANAGGAPTAPDLVVTCAVPAATLGGDGTSVGPDYTFEWTTVAGSGATLPNPNNIFLAQAASAGSYILTVRDITNGCLSRDTVAVMADTIRPFIPALSAEKITCDITSVPLNATGTTPNTGTTILWTGTNGAPSPDNQLVTMATVAGTYTLTVRNNANGCENSANVEVGENKTPPAISFATPPLFSCAFPSVVVDATASGPLANFSSITWTAINGGTVTPPSGALSITVDAPGTYELTLIRADNGCSATESVTVDPTNDTPVADAGNDFTIGCAEMTVLDGTGSTTGNYQWTNISGGAAPNPADSQNPAIDAPGTYRLVVINPANNCMDADTVIVTLDINLPNANAGADQDLCASTTTLTGNLPAGATGLWTSISSSAIVTPDQAMTDVSNLQNGASIFIWTLSAPGCANYSADSVRVVSSGRPVANNDVLNIGADTRNGSVNVTTNDVLTGIDNYEVTLIGAPTFGLIDSFVNNTLNFSVGVGARGTSELMYQICNLDCAGQCDTAIIVINVADDGNEPELPNTITPNGDGMNESLVFDVLLSNPAEDFPNNELIVFNRWGDIVYQAKPYTNNWQGTNSDGQDLPHGTYYYILRLNIGNREIIRGDVTIVK